MLWCFSRQTRTGGGRRAVGLAGQGRWVGSSVEVGAVGRSSTPYGQGQRRRWWAQARRSPGLDESGERGNVWRRRESSTAVWGGPAATGSARDDGWPVTVSAVIEEDGRPALASRGQRQGRRCGGSRLWRREGAGAPPPPPPPHRLNASAFPRHRRQVPPRWGHTPGVARPSQPRSVGAHARTLQVENAAPAPPPPPPTPGPFPLTPRVVFGPLHNARGSPCGGAARPGHPDRKGRRMRRRPRQGRGWGRGRGRGSGVVTASAAATAGGGGGVTLWDRGWAACGHPPLWTVPPHPVGCLPGHRASQMPRPVAACPRPRGRGHAGGGAGRGQGLTDKTGAGGRAARVEFSGQKNR